MLTKFGKTLRAFVVGDNDTRAQTNRKRPRDESGDEDDIIITHAKRSKREENEKASGHYWPLGKIAEWIVRQRTTFRDNYYFREIVRHASPQRLVERISSFKAHVAPPGHTDSLRQPFQIGTTDGGSFMDMDHTRPTIHTTACPAPLTPSPPPGPATRPPPTEPTTAAGAGAAAAAASAAASGQAPPPPHRPQPKTGYVDLPYPFMFPPDVIWTQDGHFKMAPNKAPPGMPMDPRSMRPPSTESRIPSHMSMPMHYNGLPRPPAPVSRSGSYQPVYDKLYRPKESLPNTNNSNGTGKKTQSRTKLAARESIRLEEKNHYARLLQQFTNVSVSGIMFENSKLRKTKRPSILTNNHTMLGSKIPPTPNRDKSELTCTASHRPQPKVVGITQLQQSRTTTTTIPSPPLATPVAPQYKRPVSPVGAQPELIDLTERSYVDLQRRRSSVELSEVIPQSKRPVSPVGAQPEGIDLTERSYTDLQRRRSSVELSEEETEHLPRKTGVAHRPGAACGAASSSNGVRSRRTDVGVMSRRELHPFGSQERKTQHGFRDGETIVISDSPERNLRSPVLDEFEQSLKDCPYTEQWLKDTITRHNEESRKKMLKIREQEARLKYYNEKREEFDRQLENSIRHRLRLSEREPVVEEYDYIESEEEDVEEQEEEFPELTDEQDAMVNNALHPHPPCEVLCEGFRLQIRRSDMETLRGLNWLNDEIVNFYFELIRERGKLDNYPTVHVFNTFFYPKVKGQGYQGVRRWTKSVDIFSVDYIAIPIHLGMHWCLAVVDFRKKAIRYFDSMGGKNMECLTIIKKYLEDEHKQKKQQPYDTSDWSLENTPGIPQQMNGSDCGVFTCKFADYVTRDKELTFTQENMPYFRRRMVYEILTKQLL